MFIKTLPPRLTTVFPVSVLSSNITSAETGESPFRMRIADDTLHWEEGKVRLKRMTFHILIVLFSFFSLLCLILHLRLNYGIKVEVQSFC